MPDPLETTLLELPYLAAAQAQKHVTHNEALKRLDGLVQIAVKASGATVPPGTPADGDRYLLGSGATGVWAGRDSSLAVYADGAWWFAAPRIGWLVFDQNVDHLILLKSSGWTAV